MRLPPCVLALSLLSLPVALAAQTADAAATRPRGCRGTTANTDVFTLARENGPPVEFPSYPEIEEVQPGSPAEAAGMKVGDKVILQGGRDVIANPPSQPVFAGDTVVFVVRRDGSEIPLTVVLGRWDPPEEAPGVTRVCRPLASRPGGE